MQKIPFLEKFLKRFSSKKVLFFWYRHYKLLFFFGFLSVAAYGGYSWYRNLYQYQWSDQQKTEFLEKNFTETAFQEKNFQDVVARLKERSRIHEQDLILERDIFGSKR